MIIVCCYCKEVLGEKKPLEDRSITHGSCKPCAKRIIAELKTIKKGG